MKESVYWVHLASFEGIDTVVFNTLLEQFGSIRNAFTASRGELLGVPGFNERTVGILCRAWDTLDVTQDRLRDLESRGFRIFTRADDDYPPRFFDATEPPPLIYQFGELQAQDDHSVAIIGSRDCSEASAKRAREYAWYFVENGLTVVSGYATGVDINGHSGALEGGGRTIIIPGCGVDVFDFAPLEPLRIRTFDDLSERAVLISEQPPDAPWSSDRCLARNRLVAAQARAVLVIEAQLHSSTLNTVSHAQKLGRPIFTQVFDDISERISGNEMLQKEGAGLVRDVGDLKRIVEIVKG